MAIDARLYPSDSAMGRVGSTRSTSSSCGAARFSKAAQDQKVLKPLESSGTRRIKPRRFPFNVGELYFQATGTYTFAEPRPERESQELRSTRNVRCGALASRRARGFDYLSWPPWTRLGNASS